MSHSNYPSDGQNEIAGSFSTNMNNQENMQSPRSKEQVFIANPTRQTTVQEGLIISNTTNENNEARRTGDTTRSTIETAIDRNTKIDQQFDPLAPPPTELPTNVNNTQANTQLSYVSVNAATNLSLEKKSIEEEPLREINVDGNMRTGRNSVDEEEITVTTSYPSAANSQVNSHDAGSHRSSEEGPMFLAAQRLAEIEQIALEEEEARRQAKQRSRLPKYVDIQKHMIMSPKERSSEQVRQNTNSALRQKKTQLSQSLMARTRSRADVDSLTAVPTPFYKSPIDDEGTARVMSTDDGGKSALPTNDDGAHMIVNPQLARKRTRVVQLLTCGLIGLVGGLFGSIYTQTSCHFATVNLGSEFDLHFGMWKYSPLDSVFQGYTYCYQYDGDYTQSIPSVARFFGLAALTLGTLSLFVLWVYLIFGRTSKLVWRIAAGLFVLAGLSQGLTGLFFVGDICRNYTCGMGPAAVISLLTIPIWFLLAYEMHHNIPMSVLLPDHTHNMSSKNNDSQSEGNFSDMEQSEIHQRAKSMWNFFPLKGPQKELAPPSLFNVTRINQSVKRSNASPPPSNNDQSYDSRNYAPGREYDDESTFSDGSYKPPLIMS